MQRPALISLVCLCATLWSACLPPSSGLSTCDPALGPCSTQNNSPNDDQDIELDDVQAEDDSPDEEEPALPTGQGALRMTVTLGRGANPFAEVAPWARETLPGFRPDLGDLWGDARSPLVVMLCRQEDPTCREPAWLRQLSDAERGLDQDGQRPLPLQGGFGPEITLSQLPEGDYWLMVFLDSLTSRSLGFGWEDNFPTTEQDWGAVVSEGDLMLSDQASMSGFNPPPAPLAISLRAGEVTELGTLQLSAFHERDISPPRPQDQGTLVVADLDGLRLVHLEDYSVQQAPGALPHTFVMRDSQGQPFAGQVCGLVDGPGGQVFVLYEGGSQGAGFAVPFDAATGQQQGGGQRILFPGQGRPCRGLYHENEQGAWLFVTDAPSGRGPEQEAGESFWGVSVQAPLGEDRQAHWHSRGQDALFRLGIDDMVAQGDQLYLSVTPTADQAAVAPAFTLGQHSLFLARFDEEGRVTWQRDAQGQPLALAVMPQGDVPVTEEGKVFAHPAVATTWAGLGQARFHDGRQLLFVGGFLAVAAYELPSLEPVRIGERPWVGGHHYGANFTGFTASPQGDLLWAIPQDKSGAHFYFQLGLEEKRQTFNRMMALPLALDQGQWPAPSGRFQGEDLDQWSGRTDIGNNETPALDPGVDLAFSHYMRYQVQWAPSTAGSTVGSAVVPVGHTVVATQSALWMRGSGTGGQADGPSGLGKGGDLAAFDLASRRAVLFPEEGDAFYPFWSGGVHSQPTMGFDLTPERGGSLVTRGLIYKP